jgi:hypothetical protein
VSDEIVRAWARDMETIHRSFTRAKRTCHRIAHGTGGARSTDPAIRTAHHSRAGLADWFGPSPMECDAATSCATTCVATGGFCATVTRPTYPAGRAVERLVEGLVLLLSALVAPHQSALEAPTAVRPRNACLPYDSTRGDDDKRSLRRPLRCVWSKRNRQRPGPWRPCALLRRRARARA